MSTARISRTKFQWKQWLAALAASSPILGIHLDVVWCSDKFLLEQTKTWLLVRPICLIIGAIIGAFLADIFGRKRSLIIMWLFTIVGLTIFIMFMLFDLPPLIVFAFIPFGSGITCVLVALYLSEISHGTNNCGKLMAVPLIVHCFRIFLYNTAYTIDPQSSHTQFVTWVTIFATSMLFHGIMMCVCPETPQYLKWKKRYAETSRSLDFYKGIDQAGLRHDPSNQSLRTKIAGYEEQGCCERFRELFKFENRRNLAVIFCLIVIRRASGQDENFRFLYYTLGLYGYYQSSGPLPLIGFCSSILIFSILVMLTMGFLARKLFVSFVMLVYFIFTILGIVRLESYWAIIGVVFVQYLCQIILIAVTLACLGEFFPINIRAMAIAIAVTFEVLTTSIFTVIYPLVHENVKYSEDMVVLMYSKCGVVLAGLFILFIFFPKTKKLPYSEIPVDSSANEECLPVQQLTPVTVTTNVTYAS